MLNNDVESNIEKLVERYLILLSNKDDYAEKIKQLQTDKKENEAEIQEIKDKLKKFLEQNSPTYKTEKFMLELKESTPTLELVDIDLVPKEFVKTTYTINKTSIKNAILFGKKVDGVKLVPATALRIVSIK